MSLDEILDDNIILIIPNTSKNSIVKYISSLDKMYNLKTLHLSYDSARKLMMDTLFICTEYHNLAAHGGRTYNYICDSPLRTTDIFDQNISVDVIKYKML